MEQGDRNIQLSHRWPEPVTKVTQLHKKDWTHALVWDYWGRLGWGPTVLAGSSSWRAIVSDPLPFQNAWLHNATIFIWNPHGNSLILSQVMSQARLLPYSLQNIGWSTLGNEPTLSLRHCSQKSQHKGQFSTSSCWKQSWTEVSVLQQEAELTSLDPDKQKKQTISYAFNSMYKSRI